MMIRSTPAAFSLIELVMVMVIISISLMIVAPNIMDHLGKAEIESQAKKIVVDLRRAQQEAITTQDMVKVVFSGTLGEYQIRRDNLGNMTWATMVKMSKLEHGVRVYETNLNAPPGWAIDYDNLGAPSNPMTGGYLKIQSDSGDERIQIDIHRATGKVEWHPL